VIPGRDRNFSFYHLVKTGTGVEPPSYLMGIGALGVKRPMSEADHSSPSSVEVNNA